MTRFLENILRQTFTFSYVSIETRFTQNTSLAVPGALKLTACNAAPHAKSKMAAKGSENGFWTNIFFLFELPCMKKGRNREKGRGVEMKKNDRNKLRLKLCQAQD